MLKRQGLVVSVAALAAVGGGGMYYYDSAIRARSSHSCEKIQLTPEVKQALEELQQAERLWMEAIKVLEKARWAEESARKTSDAAKLRDAQETVASALARERAQQELHSQRRTAALNAQRELKKQRDPKAETASNQLKKSC